MHNSVIIDLVIDSIYGVMLLVYFIIIITCVAVYRFYTDISINGICSCNSVLSTWQESCSLVVCHHCHHVVVNILN